MHSLHEALQSADSARLKRVAHTLKGNAALFGASPMVNAAASWKPCPATWAIR
jgi:HPt (histidine-containing phosphotransfer) domain-containing protein